MNDGSKADLGDVFVMLCRARLKRGIEADYDRWKADKASAAKARRKTTYDSLRLGLKR